MMGRTHFAFGLALIGAGADFGAYDLTPGLVAAAAFGSLLPDIDHPGSVIGRSLFFVSWPLATVVRHRGPIHSFAAAGGFALLLLAGIVAVCGGWPPPGTGGILAAMVLGYLSHLFLDAWNPAGVPLLYPRRKRFRFPWNVKPECVLESLFSFALSGIALIALTLPLVRGFHP